MEECQHHHACLDDAKALKKVDAVSHVDDQNHRMENLQVGLKHFVLEFPPS